MKRVYIAASWKMRVEVRRLAVSLRELGHDAFDFTDASRRDYPSGPVADCWVAPEAYGQFLNRPLWRNQMHENMQAIQASDLCVLLLPAGSDAHADWALAVGSGIQTAVVGAPDRPSKVHLWADAFYPDVQALLAAIGRADGTP